MSVPKTHVFPCTSTARVATDHPARYGKQLASHMGRKIITTRDEDSGTDSPEFNRESPTTGVVELSYDGEVPVLRLSATNEHLKRLEKVVDIRLARFGAGQGTVVR